MNSSFRSLRSSERKFPVRFWLEKMLLYEQEPIMDRKLAKSLLALGWCRVGFHIKRGE
jgi:hypothetical protein